MNMKKKKAVTAFRQESGVTAHTPKSKELSTNNITQFIPHGKENRISTKELMRLTGIRDERTLRSRIRVERLVGARIASTKANGGGYYIPETEKEKTEYLKMMHSEAIAIFVAAKSVKEEKNNGQ